MIGVYGILNTELKLAYIGQTGGGFLLRWIEHWRSLERYPQGSLRHSLFLADGTVFKILNPVTKDFPMQARLRLETDYHDSLVANDWLVISKHPELHLQKIIPQPYTRRRQKHCLQYMIRYLTTQTIYSPPQIYGRLYEKIERQFHTDLHTMLDNDSVIMDYLSEKEFHYALCQIYPWYKAMRIDQLKALDQKNKHQPKA